MNDCLRCQLAESRLKRDWNAVPGKGSKTAPIVLVSDAPIKAESINREPMAGYYGMVLDRVLKAVPLDRNLLWIDNLCKCVPLDEKGKFRSAYVDDEVKKCLPYFDQTMEEIKPKIIVALGDAALKFLSGNRKMNIRKNHGQLYWSEKYKCHLMGVFHPKVILAEYEFIKYMVQDFKKIKEFLEKGETKPTDVNYVFARDKQLLNQVLDQLSKQTEFVYDIETTGLNFLTDKILCIGFSWGEYSGNTIPLCTMTGDPYWDSDTMADLVQTLKNIFANNAFKIAYNGQFDTMFLKRAGIPVNNFSFDPMLAHHLLDENARGMRSLKQLALQYTDMGNYDAALDEYRVTNKVPKDTGMLHVPSDILAKYCSADVDATFRLYKDFKKRLEDEQLMNLFNKITMPLSNVLIDTQYRGVKIDHTYMDQLRQKLEKTKQELEVDIFTINGGPFNINSLPELRNFLFVKLGLKPREDSLVESDRFSPEGKDQSDYSTDIDALHYLVSQDKTVKLLIEYRKASKYLGTFVNGMKFDADYRVHTSYNITGTTSGRLSSSGPNLQNCPRDKAIKHLFCAQEGHTLVQCDLKAAEFRAWAHYSQDEKMIEDIKNDFDIHRFTASKVFHLDPKDVTAEQRTSAKRTTFGLMYGQGVESLAEQNNLSMTQAYNVINTLFARYPRAKAWLAYTVLQAKRNKVLTTIFGRKRRFLGFDSPGDGKEAECERQAKNFLMQSTVADLTAWAAIRLDHLLRPYNSYLVLTVHDSLVYEVPDKHVEAVKAIIQKEVTRPIKGYVVPIGIDLMTGKHWDAEKK